MTLEIQSSSLEDTEALGKKLAQGIKAPRVINLIGDLGAGKTTFTKSFAKQLGCEDEVSSPSFTIMRKYKCANETELHHYDFYRLADAGLQAAELVESFDDTSVITVIEWADAAKIDIPKNAINIKITATGQDSRKFNIDGQEDLVRDLK